MLIQEDCIPCILNMSLSAIRNVAKETSDIRRLFRKVMALPSLKGERWDVTSAEVIENVMKAVTRHSKEADPFRTEKLSQNKKLMAIYHSLEKTVRDSNEPLLSALKLAILGNSIDAMVSDKPSDMIEGMMDKIKKMEIRKEDYEIFIERLQRCSVLLYLGDNAGEIVLDRLFIDTIKDMYNLDMFYVVRSLPALNDVTREEAQFVGMEEFAHVVENGIDGPLPGTILDRCSKEMLSLVKKADLIISKGGGNFETISEEKSLNKHVTFMLVSKCQVYYRHFGIHLSQPIFANVFQGDTGAFYEEGGLYNQTS